MAPSFLPPPRPVQIEKQRREQAVVAPTPPASANGASSETTPVATSVTAPKGSLVGSVDYPEEEEEEGEGEEEETPFRKRPHLSS